MEHCRKQAARMLSKFIFYHIFAVSPAKKQAVSSFIIGVFDNKMQNTVFAILWKQIDNSLAK